jgi:hypothetical protein
VHPKRLSRRKQGAVSTSEGGNAPSWQWGAEALVGDFGDDLCRAQARVHLPITNDSKFRLQDNPTFSYGGHGASALRATVITTRRHTHAGEKGIMPLDLNPVKQVTRLGVVVDS